MTLDLTNPAQVLAGTVYGEARGGGASAMADVACVVLNRVQQGYAPDVVQVCLAPWQFSCWNEADPNRARLVAAAMLAEPAWITALNVAQAALAGSLMDHTLGADSYYATSIRAPSWTRPPAKHTVTRWLHSFWQVRQPIDTRNISHMTADQLNAAELARMGVFEGGQG